MYQILILFNRQGTQSLLVSSPSQKYKLLEKLPCSPSLPLPGLSFPSGASPTSLIYQAFLRLCSTPLVQEVLYPPLRVYLFFFSLCQSVKKINSIFTHFAALFPTHLDRLFLAFLLRSARPPQQRQSSGFNVLARVKHTSSAKVFWPRPDDEDHHQFKLDLLLLGYDSWKSFLGSRSPAVPLRYTQVVSRCVQVNRFQGTGGSCAVIVIAAEWRTGGGGASLKYVARRRRRRRRRVGWGVRTGRVPKVPPSTQEQYIHLWPQPHYLPSVTANENRATPFSVAAAAAAATNTRSFYLRSHVSTSTFTSQSHYSAEP